MTTAPALAPSNATDSPLLYRWLPVLLTLLAVGFYARFLLQHAINVPFHDDILDVLKLFVTLNSDVDSGTKLDAFFAQHNDHRTLASRLIYYVSYRLQGEVNFATLSFIANLAMPILALLFYTQINDERNRWLIFSPIIFLLFQLRTYGVTEWAMAAFAFFYVYLYGIVALFCLHTATRTRFLAGVLFAVLSTFTIASGQAVWVIGLLCLLHQAYVLRRISYLYSAAWSGIAVLVLIAYRSGLETPNTLLALIQFALATPFKHLQYFLGMLGSGVSFDVLLIAQLVGAVLLILLLWQAIRNYRAGYSKLEYACWFVVLSAATVTLGRAPYSEIQYSQTSRYSFASILLIACVWLSMNNRYRIARSYQFIAIAATAMICAASYSFYAPKFDVLMEARIAAFNRGHYRVYGQPPAYINALVVEAIEKGIYHPPSRPLAAPAVE